MLLKVLRGEAKRTGLDFARSPGFSTTMDRRQEDPGGRRYSRVGERRRWATGKSAAEGKDKGVDWRAIQEVPDRV